MRRDATLSVRPWPQSPAKALRREGWPIRPLGRAFVLLTWCLCAASVAGFAGGVHWALDLLSHFRPHYAVALLPAAVLCWWRGARRTAVLAGACLGLQAGVLLPLWVPPEPAPGTAGPPFRVLLANVHTRNRDFAAVRDLLRSESPDIVVLQETDRAWLDALADLRSAWPHHVEEARGDNFGIAVWSRLPLHGAALVRLDRTGLPSVVARVQHGAASFALIATHPIPPVGRVRTALRDENLAEVARRAAASALPVLVVGDLNCTPWSPRFRTLLRDGALRDSGEGHGYAPTWPARLSWLGIPLDHCLYGAGLRVVARRVGAPTGSDHRPLVVDLACTEY